MALDRRVDRLEHALERLAEAQVKAEERLARLETAVERLTERLDRLEAVVERLTERLDRLEAVVERLAEAQVRTEERLVRLEGAVERLTGEVGRLTGEVGALKGDTLERRYRENAPAYFQQILRGIHLVPKEELGQIADDAEDRGVLSVVEHGQLLRADVVVRGRRRETGAESFLLAEVSSVVDQEDVQRAAERARLLERATGVPVVAAAAGDHMTPTAEQQAATLGVWRVLNGRAHPPGE